MSNSFNRTVIIGRLGRDPELRQGPKAEYARFSLSNASFHDGQEEVQWHTICAFGKQARVCHEHLHKGDLCCIEGRLDKRGYTRNGERFYAHSIIADRVTFLASKRREDVPTCDTREECAVDEAFPA